MPREVHGSPRENQLQRVFDISDELRVKISPGEIESALRELKFHPDFLDEKNVEFEAYVEKFKKSVGERTGDFYKLRDEGHREANQLWNANMELTLLKKYYPSRVRFLCELVGYVSGLSASRPKVADDGCGGGVDIYCLRKKLGDKVELVGVDQNPFAMETARARNPGVEFREQLEGGGEFDVVYADFVEWGRGNMGVPEIADKRDKWSSALRERGLLIQNVDFSEYERNLYTSIISSSFRLTRDERIQEVPNNKDCHLLVFEKKVK